MIQSQIYLVNTVTLERLEFQFIPFGLTFNREADVQEVKIVGRNEPKFQYSGGKTTLPLELDFYAEDAARLYVVKSVKWLETLTMADGFDRGAPKVKLIWGKFLRDEVWVVKNLKPSYSLFNRTLDMLPMQAKVEMELLLDPVTNTKWSDVLWR